MVATYRTLAPGAKREAAAYAAYLLERTMASGRPAQAAAGHAQGQGAAEEGPDATGSVPRVRADLDPALAAALGLAAGAALEPGQLGNILGGRRADGEEIDRGDADGNAQVREYKDAEGETVRHRVAAMDVTWSAPKSLSVAWALAATGAERASLLQAHRDAVADAMGYLEEQIARASFGKARSGGEEIASLAWVAIEHFTARPTVEITRADPETGTLGTEIHTVRAGDPLRGDPHLHTHAVVPNLMATASGRLVAVNRDALRGRVHELGAVYHMMLAKHLRASGVEVALCPRTLTARLAAVPEGVCEAFSHRTANGTAAARAFAAEQGLDWDGLDADRKLALLKSGTQRHKLPKDAADGPSRRQREEHERAPRQDDVADLDAWAAMGRRAGWSHGTTVAAHASAAAAAPVAEDERARLGWEASGALLEAELDRRAVLRVSDARLAAARGLIASGAEETADVDRVLARMGRDGVRQQGQRTDILAPAGLDDPQAGITTALHRDQEREVVRLVRAAAADTRHRLTPAALRAVTAGQDFSGRIGLEQKRAIGKVGVGGAVSVFVGVAGTGKTSRVIPPLVAGWRRDGREVWGVALAWRQANALAEGGIEHARTFAMQPFLDGLRGGGGDGPERPPLAVGRDAVVVVDEFSQIGTRQLLELLRAQRRGGFKVVLTGDERQCQSIEAGPVIELLAEALGPRAIPEILTTVRQRSERERLIAALFRGRRGDGPEDRLRDVARAVAMKREDGTAELVPGGREEAVRRAAEAYMEAVGRNRGDPGYKVTVSAPTNADAMEIGLAIRALRRRAGEVGADQAVVAAMDGAGNRYDMAIAPGDRVRLFRRTHARFAPDRPGHGERSALAGNNGTVLTVRRVVDERVRAGRTTVERSGLEVETPGGKTGFVAWDALRAPGTTRALLAYGDCLTIDSSQGLTSDEHINALPGGSRAVQGFKNYVASSRHRVRSLLLSSAGAELRQVDEVRPAGVEPPKAWADREREAWDNLVANVARQPVKDTAMRLLRDGLQEQRQSIRGLQRHWRATEERQRAGLAPTTLRESLDQAEAARQSGFAPRAAPGQDLDAAPTTAVVADQTGAEIPKEMPPGRVVAGAMRAAPKHGPRMGA